MHQGFDAGRAGWPLAHPQGARAAQKRVRVGERLAVQSAGPRAGRHARAAQAQRPAAAGRRRRGRRSGGRSRNAAGSGLLCSIAVKRLSTFAHNAQWNTGPLGRRGAPLALALVLAVVAEVDGARAVVGQPRIVRRLDRLGHDLQVLLVARHEHAHVVAVPHLHAGRPGASSSPPQRTPRRGGCPDLTRNPPCLASWLALAQPPSHAAHDAGSEVSRRTLGSVPAPRASRGKHLGQARVGGVVHQRLVHGRQDDVQAVQHRGRRAQHLHRQDERAPPAGRARAGVRPALSPLERRGR